MRSRQCGRSLVTDKIKFMQKRSLFQFHIVHQALLIGILLFSESVAGTPKQFSPLVPTALPGNTTGGKGGSSIAQQPTATGQEATRAAAERADEEGAQIFEQGTPESLRQAIAKWEEALQLRRRAGDRQGEVITLIRIGSTYSDLGETQKALDYYNQALLLSRSIGDRNNEEIVQYYIDKLYPDTAKQAFNQGVQLCEQGTAESLQQAIAKFEQALPLYRQLGDKAQEARTLFYIGFVYDALGEKQKALDYYNQSLPLTRTLGNKQGEAATLNNIAGVYNTLGEKQKALDYYNQSLSLNRALGDKAKEAVILNNIGQVYTDLGEKQKALEFFNQSLPLHQAIGNKAGEAIIFNNIAGVYSDLGETQKALDYYNQSLILNRAIGNKAKEAIILNNIAGVYGNLGEKQKALDYYIQALSLTRVAGDKAQEATTLNNIGLVYDDLGEKQKALDYYNQSLPLTRATGDKAGEARTLYNLAILKRDTGNFNEALTNIESAIKIVEELRTKIASQQLRASYFATVQDYYQFYIYLLMHLHKTNPSKGYDAQALHISERAKARSLVELLAEANVNIHSGADSQLREQERNLQQQLNGAEQSRVKLLEGSYTEKQLTEIKQKIASLLTELDFVQAKIRQNNPAYAAISQPGAFTLTLPQIQQQVIDENTLLLTYSIGKESSYLWVVTKTGFASYSLPKAADIETAAKEFRQVLTDANADESEIAKSAAKLSQLILSPVANQLGNKRLLIVSDGILQYIPFGALPIPTSPGAPLLQGEGRNTTSVPASEPQSVTASSYTPLLVQNEVVSLPSASALAVLRNQVKNRPATPKTLAVIADPIFTRDDPRFSSAQSQPQSSSDAKTAASRGCESLERLEFSGKEAENILALVPAASRLQALGFDASRAAVTRPDLSQYQIVHFATHGCVSEDHPELSGVALSQFDQTGADQDGFLRLHDIFNLNLPAELVVLSACQTGIGKQVQGEGLIGLTRGFMYAGAKRVVVSLWSVNDAATSQLMQKYYQQMLQKKLNPVEALRAAQ